MHVGSQAHFENEGSVDAWRLPFLAWNEASELVPSSEFRHPLLPEEWKPSRFLIGAIRNWRSGRYVRTSLDVILLWRDLINREMAYLSFVRFIRTATCEVGKRSMFGFWVPSIAKRERRLKATMVSVSCFRQMSLCTIESRLTKPELIRMAEQGSSKEWQQDSDEQVLNRNK